MATIVGEAFLAVSLELLLKKIISGEFVDFFRSTKLDVEKVNITLVSLQAVLHDAEEKQITNPAVRNWLDMLRDAVFEADDLFDEINTEALRRKVEAEYKSRTAKVMTKISSRFKRFNKKINDKLQKLYERLECLRQQNLGLKEGVSRSVWNVTPTTCIVGDESDLCGREDDKNKLKEFLLSEDGSTDGGSKIGVISIVGMGGLGKTTLAKHLYNDLKVREKFEVRGWAHVSKDLDVVALTKALLVSVTTETIVESDFNKLQVQLQQSLRNKKYLLVLDDIWDGTYVDWNRLNDIFNVGEMGSKIIITTRDERVALPVQAFLCVHHLRSLEAEDCESLLERHAFVGSNNQQRSNLKEIGKEIAKKCGGLPLAAVALGGLLRDKLSQDHWNEVLKSSIWELTTNEVQPALLLSYRYLPAPLKGCFAYCSIFSKNSVLEKTKIVQLWIAEGLVPQPKSEKSWEKVAEQYFDELVSRSLIRQRSIDGKEVSFEMHDLINDLAMLVSSLYCIRMDEQKPEQKPTTRVRHLSYNRGERDFYDTFDKLQELKGLRTFLPLPFQKTRSWHSYSISEKLVCDLLPQMKQLHVLSLSNYQNISKLPNSIGNLIFLRYLNLSGTMIERLPFETCSLYNLQTLLLLGCKNLIELPKDMGKLVNLRHLDIKGTGLKEMPKQICKLENLQTLSDFVVSNQDVALGIADLGKCPQLRGNLSISQLENVIDSSHVFEAKLEMKEQIDELELHWSGVTPSNSEIQSVVFERLRPSNNLKSLTINGYGGKTFPTWMGDSLFRNMVCMRISNCDNCTELPSLGQIGNLKELFISNMKSVKNVGNEFYGSSSSPLFQPFPSLEILGFEDMKKWEEWKVTGGTSTEFPKLTHLSLYNIPSLTSFPKDSLPKTLQSLKVKNCENLDFLPDESLVSYKSLEVLEISSTCNSMTSFTLCSVSVLKHLEIRGCKNLKSISIAESTSLLFLRTINVSSCNELESFSLGGLPIPNLIELSVMFCKKLRSLPESIKTQASCLQKVYIYDLPNLQSFSIEDLPISLWSLDIRDVKVEGILEKTNWERLTSLSWLTIYSHEIVNSVMKSEVPLLPTSLGSLWISDLEEIESLDGKWLQHLTSLQKLFIRVAPKLKSLPGEGNLPSSLKKLDIYACPLLNARLQKKEGKEWRKIAHIPNIVIKDKWIIQ